MNKIKEIITITNSITIIAFRLLFKTSSLLSDCIMDTF
ncbi:hypothetical protein EU94_0328 [Prochlorococcus marinus str. MIT 9123]|nr:hypothetical protein EU94_0328 [Prochlorococcus marinus str. MIT 9123]